ncbi:YvrJ family protein [Clostridium tagluense]|nr:MULTISPECIES: YvrJ family protein [Clostridium]MBZ9622500.1 YvrJ family protein [Clostridium sp. FP2]MBZ9634059.1 YvrJ family protein [Clostridium sp. FP1]MCB2312918.1 YvrJ family protein [Clostridium tagluense]MCB2317684.1 YvrJ family protein [Clostridium tagluense]MCB2322482.1 YvrJ family protein [Clostridium tagluense]
MGDFYTMVTNIGFPIAVTGFLLIRVEKKLDELNNTLIKMMELIAKND